MAFPERWKERPLRQKIRLTLSPQLAARAWARDPGSANQMLTTGNWATVSESREGGRMEVGRVLRKERMTVDLWGSIQSNHSTFTFSLS